jgi:hypothetical protein
MPRALYLAYEAGINATGLTADLHQWSYQGQEERNSRDFLPGQGDRPTRPLNTPPAGSPGT